MEKMKPLAVPRNAPEEKELTAKEITRCRKSLGEGNWLQSQTRVDIAVQVN